MADVQELKRRYEAGGQGHVFATYDSLSASDRAELVDQLGSIDVGRANAIFQKALSTPGQSADHEKITPPPKESSKSLLDDPSKAEEWRNVGIQAIKKGKVGVLLLAGGQGTRLGSSAPKGCYDIGLPSGKSLFQLQGEKIRRLEALAGGNASIPWYVMTSGPTRKPTEDFFRKHDFFGLSASNVIFFEQGVLPAFTKEGKFILETPSRLAVAPDGNGGLYSALLPSSSTSRCSSPHGSVLADLERRGVEYVHAYCVDNCLVRVADPVFVGYCVASSFESAVKVVRKTQPNESVGVVAQRDGKWGVVEYSEIPSALAEERDPATGQLSFRAANIANHFYTRAFLSRIDSFSSDMAYHVAHKKIPHFDPSASKQVKPDKPNGIKLELFIFDVLPFVDDLGVLEVDRAEEFSPLKNAPGTGSDDPGTSRRDLLAQQRRWLEAESVELGEGAEVELSPLVSYAGEGLAKARGKKVVKGGKVETERDLDGLA